MAKVKGLWKRGRIWWLRYTPSPGAKQVRISLETEIDSVAEVMALERIQSAPLVPADEYQIELDRYLAEMKAGETLGSSISSDRRYLLEAFARDMRIVSLSDISMKSVEDWIKLLKKGDRVAVARGEGAEGGKNRRKKGPVKQETAETYVMRIRAFVNWLVKKRKIHANPLKELHIGKRVKTWRKDFVRAERVRELIADAPDDEIRFALFCGMHAGLRKLEVVEAPPSWFVLGDGIRRGCINVGETPTFRPKDREERTIPLTTDFEAFLRLYLPTLPEGARWVLKPEKKHGKWRYRYDFRVPFAKYMKAKGVKCTPHDMRRSFVSNKLIENPALLPKLAKWTSDDVKTMMDHYAHLLADDDDIDAGL